MGGGTKFGTDGAIVLERRPERQKLLQRNMSVGNDK